MFTQQEGFFFGRGRGGGGGVGALRESSPSCESQILFVLFSFLEKIQIPISSKFWISCKYSDNLVVL